MDDEPGWVACAIGGALFGLLCAAAFIVSGVPLHWSLVLLCGAAAGAALAAAFPWLLRVFAELLTWLPW